MGRFMGGLLASAATAAALGFTDPMLCSIEGEGDTGAGGSGLGGAAALLEEDDPAAAAAAAAAAGGGGDDKGGDPPAVADWMKGFSADKAGDELSHQEWLAKIGAKDPNDVVARYRQLEKAHRESGKVKIPGENATDEEKAAFREAIGAPKEAAGYEVKMPEGAENFEIDASVIDPLKEIAHKHGIPKAGFEELANVFLGKALEDAKEEVARTDREADEVRKAWGADKDRKTVEFRRGAEALGLTAQDIQAIQREYGGGKTLELFQKIGAMMGEDFFAGGGMAAKFGVANIEAAQAGVDKFINTPDLAAKLRAGDPGTKAAYNSAVQVLSEFKRREAAKNG